jgi:hypothetical protein
MRILKKKIGMIVSLTFSFLALTLNISALGEDEWFQQSSVNIPNETPNYFNGVKGGLTKATNFQLFNGSASD